MQLKKIAAVLLGTFAIAGSASAVTFEGASGSAAVTDYSAGSLLSFDLDFSSLNSVVLNFKLDASDIGSGLSFNSLVRNLSGLGIDEMMFKISGASFNGLGNISNDGFHAITGSGKSATGGWATFAPGLTTEFYIGSPFDNSNDWGINLAGLNAGDTFSIMVAVPEPEQYAMLLAGLGVIGAVARRRKQA